jgi:hypothetical protein
MTIPNERGVAWIAGVGARAGLDNQPRSAWTQELELRPFKEPF